MTKNLRELIKDDWVCINIVESDCFILSKGEDKIGYSPRTDEIIFRYSDIKRQLKYCEEKKEKKLTYEEMKKKMEKEHESDGYL